MTRPSLRPRVLAIVMLLPTLLFTNVVGALPTPFTHKKVSQLGLGPMHTIAQACVELPNDKDCSSRAETDLRIALGLEGPIALGQVFLAPEGRFNFYTGGDNATGFLLGLHMGAVF